MDEDSGLRLSSTDEMPITPVRTMKSKPNRIMIIDDDTFLQIVHSDYCIGIDGVKEDQISCYPNGEEALEELE
jgi:hypothetical protein